MKEQLSRSRSLDTACDEEEEEPPRRPFWVPSRVSWRSSRSHPDGLEGGRCKAAQAKVTHLLTSWKFDAFIGICICINSVMVGVDQQFRLEGRSADDPAVQAMTIMEQMFLTVYTVELAMRFFSLGLSCLSDHWVKFDLVLVILGIVNSWVLEQLMNDRDTLGPLMVLRTGRLLRLARTVRLLVKFQVLWMLVRGLLTSACTMLYTLVVLIVILYIFSCIGFELITNSSLRQKDPEFDAIVSEWFPEHFCIMLTLLQFVCLDSVGQIYRPLIIDQFHLLVYFTGIILVVPIVLMNLITAVIVNGFIEQAEQDKDQMASHEEHKRRLMIQELAKTLDDDQSGKVSLDELRCISASDRKALSRLTNCSDPEDIFNALDVNNEGELTIKEFCDGIWQVAISKVPLEMMRMEMQVNQMHQSLRSALREQAEFREQQASFRDAMEAFKQEALGMLGHTSRPHTPHSSHRSWLSKEDTSKLDELPGVVMSEAELGDGTEKLRLFIKLADGMLPSGCTDDDPISSSTPGNVLPSRTPSLLTDIAGASTEVQVQRLEAIRQEAVQLREVGGSVNDGPPSSYDSRYSQDNNDDGDTSGTAESMLAQLGDTEANSISRLPSIASDNGFAPWAPPTAAVGPVLLTARSGAEKTGVLGNRAAQVMHAKEFIEPHVAIDIKPTGAGHSSSFSAKVMAQI